MRLLQRILRSKYQSPSALRCSRQPELRDFLIQKTGSMIKQSVEVEFVSANKSTLQPRRSKQPRDKGSDHRSNFPEGRPGSARVTMLSPDVAWHERGPSNRIIRKPVSLFYIHGWRHRFFLQVKSTTRLGKWFRAAHCLRNMLTFITCAISS